LVDIERKLWTNWEVFGDDRTVEAKEKYEGRGARHWLERCWRFSQSHIHALEIDQLTVGRLRVSELVVLDALTTPGKEVL
jgi:hypothetical protein